MLLALAEQDIAPDLIVGTSAGAINAAWIAERPGLDGARQLADIWRTIRRRDVFPVNPLLGLLGLLGRRDYLVGSGRLRGLLATHLRLERLEQSPTPLRVVATEITTGLEVVIDEGPAIDAVTASAAIPSVFPTVTVDGRHLVDGGVADNTPISYAIGAGASTVYVLPTGYACSLDQPPRGALGIALQAINLLVQQRLRADVEQYRETASLRVIPPLCPLNVSPLDFSHTSELIDRAYHTTREWFALGQPRRDEPAVLDFHDHSQKRTSS